MDPKGGRAAGIAAAIAAGLAAAGWLANQAKKELAQGDISNGRTHAQGFPVGAETTRFVDSTGHPTADRAVASMVDRIYGFGDGVSGPGAGDDAARRLVAKLSGVAGAVGVDASLADGLAAFEDIYQRTAHDRFPSYPGVVDRAVESVMTSFYRVVQDARQATTPDGVAAEVLDEVSQALVDSFVNDLLRVTVLAELAHPGQPNPLEPVIELWRAGALPLAVGNAIDLCERDTVTRHVSRNGAIQAGPSPSLRSLLTMFDGTGAPFAGSPQLS